MFKFITILALSLMLTSGFSLNPHVTYKKLIRDNNFWTYPKLVIKESPVPQAYNKNYHLVLFRGMIVLCDNVHELAWVLGHELAHYKLWHRKSTPANEYEADRLAVQYMTKAGYDACKGVKIILHFNPKDSKSHPAARKRYNRVRC